MEQEHLCTILIKQIGDTLQKNGDNEIKKKGLTLAQLIVLLALYETPDKRLSLKELEKVINTAQSSTARIVMKLENKGFVDSLGDPADKRIKYIQITPLGEQFCDNARRSLYECEENLLSPLTEVERTVFFSLLQKVRNNFK